MTKGLFQGILISQNTYFVSSFTQLPSLHFRFHRAAFIFIANMALADLLLVFVQIAEVALIKMKNDDMDTAFNFASIDKGNQTYKFQALDEKIILTCK